MNSLAFALTDPPSSVIPFRPIAENINNTQSTASTARNEPTFITGPGAEEIWNLEEPTDNDIFDDLRDKIRSYADMPEGWDTYDAGPPSTVAINLALSILKSIEEESPPIQSAWAAPTSDESILLQIETPDVLIKFEIDSDGDIGAMTKQDEETITFHDLDKDGTDKFVKDVFGAYVEGRLQMS